MNSEVHELHGAGLVLRAWCDADLDAFAALNADPEVMAHFPAPLTRAESDALAARARERLAAQGHGWWALQTPALAFAGFVGLAPVPFELPAALWPSVPGAPVMEIGWRLARAAWGRGDASTAARLVLDYARHGARLPGVVSFTAQGNLRSQAVMHRIGLNRLGEFDHPRLPEGHRLRRHVLYGTAWAPTPASA